MFSIDVKYVSDRKRFEEWKKKGGGERSKTTGKAKKRRNYKVL
jgi:hypothetical protein